MFFLFLCSILISSATCSDPLVKTLMFNLYLKKASEYGTSEMTSVRLPDVSTMVYVPWFNTTDNDLTYTIKEQEKCVL